MTADGKPLHCWGRRTCSVCTCTREFSWSFLLAPVAFPILGADFLSNFRLLVDISNKRLVARGGKLIQLEQGKPTKAAVVTGVVAAPPPPVVVSSPPLLPTVEAPSSSSSEPPAATQHARGGQEAQGRGNGHAAGSAHLYNFTSHSEGIQHQRWLIRAAGSQPARRGGQEASNEV